METILTLLLLLVMSLRAPSMLRTPSKRCKPLFSSKVAMDEGSELDSISGAIECLTKYDKEYLKRMTKGRKEGISPQQVEFDRAQILGASGLKAEWTSLRIATTACSSDATEIVLGIMCDTGSRGIDILRAWVTGLALPRGTLRAVDVNNQEVEYELLAVSVPSICQQ